MLITAVVAAGVLALLVLLLEMRWQPLLAADRALSRALETMASSRPGLVGVMQVASGVGQPLTWWILHSTATVYLLARRHRREACFVAVTAAGGGLLTTAGKALTGRERPQWAEPVSHASGFAFPSGHTTGTAIGVAVLLIVFVPVLAAGWRRVTITLGTVLIVAVGASRMVLGVQWGTDVVGALLLTAAWVSAMVLTFRMGGLPEKAPHR